MLFNPPSGELPRDRFPVLVVTTRNEDSVRLLSLLRDMHCQVHSASICRQAIQSLHSATPPVVLTDKQLADGDWKDIVNEASRLRLPPSVIVVSEDNDFNVWQEVLSHGGFDVLSKPYSAESLTWMVLAAYRRWLRAMETDEARRNNARGPVSPAPVLPHRP
jgi:DNA-binding NtrC family response regulator